MLESLTIFSKGGLVLYQYTSSPDNVVSTRQFLNGWVSKILLNPAGDANNGKSFHISAGLTFVWLEDPVTDSYAVGTYPDIVFEGPRQYLLQWTKQLLVQTVKEYNLYVKAVQVQATKVAEEKQADGNDTTVTSIQDRNKDRMQRLRPDQAVFDKTFRALLQQHKTQKGSIEPEKTEETHAAATKTTTTTTKQPKKGKEKRNWHTGNAKVTDKAMAELDMSKDAGGRSPNEVDARALQEARAAYLPNPEELENDTDEVQVKKSDDRDTSDRTWGSSVTGLLQQLTGNKVLAAQDLELPLKKMQELLVSKNVAAEIASQLCQSVQTKLVGKRLNSLYRVQTAVQQALEDTLTKILHNKVDLLHAAMSKRGDHSLFKSSSKKAPYVVCVMGINGVGKSTSLAKLAYYFKSHDCNPLLVAGDTFRSGAVEQLRVHAECLDVPLFSQGYSKDPSAVAKAAIAHATEEGHDVVLVDTAGRMQNNVPLMKALGKLVSENKPDFVIFVCEALVGHDGLSQFKLFQQALGGRFGRGIDGLLLTKFDTVSDKVGAALTLTHECAVPIVFCGTGQKYHHLKKLSPPAVVESLFS